MDPSCTIHLVGLPSMLAHCERSLPSKRTVASEGALPAFSCVLAVAGVISGGNGRVRSWSNQFGSGCARQMLIPTACKKARKENFRIEMIRYLVRFIKISRWYQPEPAAR